MDDHAGALLKHLRQQGPVEPDSGKAIRLNARCHSPSSSTVRALTAILFVGLNLMGSPIWASERFAPADPGSVPVEVTGMQFAWYFRYPGRTLSLAGQIPSLWILRRETKLRLGSIRRIRQLKMTSLPAPCFYL